jgi:hypothetical protein
MGSLFAISIDYGYAGMYLLPVAVEIVKSELS